MRDLLGRLEEWHPEERPVALATVVKVYGSPPRPLGSKMPVSSKGEMAGSVSGGCVEGAVVEEARAVLKSGRARLVRFGISNEEAWSVGLTCGGELEVFVERLSPDLYRVLKKALVEDALVARAVVVAGPGRGDDLLVWPDGTVQGTLEPVPPRVRDWAGESLLQQKNGRLRVEGAAGPQEFFCEIFSPPPKLIIVGAVHVAIHLVRFAGELGFKTIVVDPRAAFATSGRFHHADELRVGWPREVLGPSDFDQATCLAVLSHDPRIDNPALQLGLESPCRYLGALGSRKTHARRLASLKERGLSQDQLDRIHAPIGLNLGGRRPQEIALSVMAEIVSVQHGVDRS